MLMKFVDLYDLKASSITSADIQKILNTFIKRGGFNKLCKWNLLLSK